MAKITVKTVDEIKAVIKKKISITKNQYALELIGQYMVRDVVFRFKNNQIKPKTKQITLLQRRVKGGKRIKDFAKAETQQKYINQSLTLVDTGRLMRSIRYKINFRKNTVYIGTNVQYAAIHQFGGRAGRRKSVKITKRPFLYFTSVNRLQIMRIIKKVMEMESI